MAGCDKTKDRDAPKAPGSAGKGKLVPLQREEGSQGSLPSRGSIGSRFRKLSGILPGREEAVWGNVRKR